MCTKEYIDQAVNLKLIIRGGVGIDNIDKAYADSKGIIVRNTPKSSAIAVAELAFALMLSTPNNLVAYHNGMKRGEC
jgi:D-3-phosphoglycerate dehydrogenase